MDPLSQLLSGIRADGAVVSEAVLESPWTISFQDRAPLTMLTMVRGSGVLLLHDGGEMKIVGGQTAVVRGPEPFLLADEPGSASGPHHQYRLSCFEPAPECGTYDDFGGKKWGNCPDGSTAVLVASYRATGRHDRLLRSLPPALVVEDGTEVCAWLDAAAAEIADRKPGTQALIDRLFDWGLVCTLRTWFDQEGCASPNWYRGFSDPVVGPALEAMHTSPERPWTVATLAAESGVSRALLAKRFTEIMGEPPLSYLADWRMEVAEGMLADHDRTIAEVARAVGYADAFGFSAAFKRRRGMSPSAFRAAKA
ncbi:AraC family transcriptional regulator [Glycomyces halotolerans]